jgi:hypothetical protein
VVELLDPLAKDGFRDARSAGPELDERGHHRARGRVDDLARLAQGRVPRVDVLARLLELAVDCERPPEGSLSEGAGDSSVCLGQHRSCRSQLLVDGGGAVADCPLGGLSHLRGERRVARRPRVDFRTRGGGGSLGRAAGQPVQAPLAAFDQCQSEVVAETGEHLPGRGSVGLASLGAPVLAVRVVGQLCEEAKGVIALVRRRQELPLESTRLGLAADDVERDGEPDHQLEPLGIALGQQCDRPPD